jgi:ABC-type Zn2+ transport system substrate-binding protein/surface adhesin
MTLRVTLLMLIFGICVSSNTQSQNAERFDVILLSGEVRDVYLIKELSSIDENDRIKIANLYSVDLINVFAIDGDLDQESITLELTATHESSINHQGEIFVLVKKNDQHLYETLYWGVPSRVACIPKEKLVELGIMGEYDDFHKISRSFCEFY